jgi:EAL domain-containing protein (putative c-di-GMP-specific phosphodiesterase class I)
MADGSRDRHAAVVLDDFHPFFQPIVELRTGTVHAYEILARWRHPQRGWVTPESFIPDAEAEGWIDALTWELLGKALVASAALSHPVVLAVNISPLQLRDEALPERMQRIADAHGFPLDHLIVEITESALARDLTQARSIVTALKRRGCQLALDDFGTGYSSLSQLESLPFDEIKVDGSFTAAMSEKRSCRKIVAAVVGLGQSLGLRTVAESVATNDQAEMLRWLGCDFAQGWLYGMPISAEQLQAADRAASGAAPHRWRRVRSPRPERASRTCRRSVWRSCRRSTMARRWASRCWTATSATST